MHRLVIASVVLSCASVPGCASEPEQPSSSVGSPVHAEFVPDGPVRTEQEAVATAWRYMLAHYNRYLDPPVAPREVDGEMIQYVSLTAIDIGAPPDVTRNRRSGFDQWELVWQLRDDMGRVGIAVDSRTGAAEPLTTADGI